MSLKNRYALWNGINLFVLLPGVYMDDSVESKSDVTAGAETLRESLEQMLPSKTLLGSIERDVRGDLSVWFDDLGIELMFPKNTCLVMKQVRKGLAQELKRQSSG